MLLLIDNYDSFAHNLARYLRQLGQEVVVVRNDQITVRDIKRHLPSAIVISPGPGTPDDAGICLNVVSELHPHIPMLGVCLGHQVICQAFGGTIRRTTPVHGRSGQVWHRGHSLFDGLPSPVVAARYHSLVVAPETLPATLEILATLSGPGHSPPGEQPTVMAVAHRHFPVYGVQFHPESILTTGGYQLLANFLRITGVASRVRWPVAPAILPAADAETIPEQPLPAWPSIRPYPNP